MTNLYEVLDVSRSASLSELQKAYRIKAIKWHPERNQTQKNVAVGKFDEVALAYQVLSDQRNRSIYDKFGLEGLEEGVVGLIGNGKQKRFQRKDANVVFEEFFGTQSPFSCFFQNYGLDSTSTDPLGLNDFGPRHQEDRQEPEQIRDLFVSLEDFLHGKRYLQTLTIRKLQPNGELKDQETSFHINITPGMKSNSNVRFQKAFHQGPGIIPADIIFVVREKQHPKFTRDGADLHHTAKVPLLDALVGGFVEIQTLDERLLRIPLNEVISAKSRKVVKNEGFPKDSDCSERGDLILSFDVEFPAKLSPEQKEALKDIL